MPFPFSPDFISCNPAQSKPSLNKTTRKHPALSLAGLPGGPIQHEDLFLSLFAMDVNRLNCRFKLPFHAK
jgi:hypothetical protein